MNFKNKNVLVYGLSISGEWASKLLKKNHANVYLYDDNIKILNKAYPGCYIIEELNENYIEQFDFLVVSPSIEKENKFLLIAKKHNKKIYSELELASLFAKDYIAVTGTNGKTTTVQLITHILNKKKKTIACGNIGYSFSQAVMEKKNYLKVVEVSSFMLENAQDFSPKVATVLNIQPDHLIRHKTMEEYTSLKLSIFKNLKSKDYAIINLDNGICSNKNCKTITYSISKIADIYIKNGYIYLHENKIVATNELSLKGKHNLYNIMCAIACAYIYKVNLKKIRLALLEFKSEHFRIENVATINNINFYNDSKSTNIASTLASVDTIKGSIILILGGSKKALDYTYLFYKLSKRVKQVIVFGEIAEDLVLANNNKFKMEKFNNLSESFDFAVGVSKKYDNILFSPASASYDQYKNYIERGNHFNNLVKEYEAKNK